MKNVVTAYKETSDDWYPAYKVVCGSDNFLVKNVVRVKFTQTGPNPPTAGLWRVCVWGADDDGMERDFDSEAAAWRCFKEVIALNDVTHLALAVLGLVRA